MKKKSILLVLLLLTAALFAEDFPWATYNVKAGEEIKMPIEAGFLFYGKTNFKTDDWDYSIPKEFGKKTLVAIFPYTYYFEGEKQELYYELIIHGVNLKKDISKLKPFTKIEMGTVIGTASTDNPGILIRTVNGADPNLILDSPCVPVSVGDYMYFDAATLMSSTPKFLTFMPVSSKDDMIEFWDYPESLEDLAKNTINDDSQKQSFSTYPTFQIMVKTRLKSYPEAIHTESTSTSSSDTSPTRWSVMSIPSSGTRVRSLTIPSITTATTPSPDSTRHLPPKKRTSALAVAWPSTNTTTWTK